MRDVLLLGALAALCAGFGPLFVRGRDGDGDAAAPAPLIGFADALAAGMMLGIGYALMTWGIGRDPLAATVGAAFGVVLMYWMRLPLETRESPEQLPLDHRGWAVAAASIHAIPEGLALGAAASLGLTIAITVAATLAIHNVSESAVLVSRLHGADRRGVRAAALSVFTNHPQVVFSVAAYAVCTYVPPLTAPLLGLSFGALVYLCFAELLPDSYRSIGRSSIALVVTIAAGLVALASGRV